MAVKLCIVLVEISQIVVVLIEMSILICYIFAGTGKPDTCGYLSSAGKVSYPQVHSRASKGWQHGYTHGWVNALSALTQPAAIPNIQVGHLPPYQWEAIPQ
jgi:hypothetical protein